MGWFWNRRAAQQIVTDAELASLWAELGAKASILASGRGRSAVAVALEAELAVLSDGSWERFGWHEIQHGGWDRDSRELTWVLIDGSRHRVALDEPGDVPEVFQERVGASIVTQHRLRVPDTNFVVVIAARRALTAGSPIVWTVQPLGSTDLADERVRDFVLDATDRLAAEYAEFES